MVCDAKNIFLAGIGAAVVSYEKASEISGYLIKRGRTAVDEGMELSKELKRNIKQTTSEMKERAADTLENISPVTKEDLKQTLENLNFASKGDILELKRRVEALEEDRLNSNNNSLT